MRKKGGRPVKYENGLEKIIKFCEAKTPERIPADFACAPLLDNADENDERVLKILRQMGIADASKAPKGKLKYGKSTGTDRCDGCAHWIDDPQQTQYGLGRCEIVDGLVRTDRWCTKYVDAGTDFATPDNEE